MFVIETDMLKGIPTYLAGIDQDDIDMTDCIDNAKQYVSRIDAEETATLLNSWKLSYTAKVVPY